MFEIVLGILAFILFLNFIFVVVMYRFSKRQFGCSGDCNQGRRPCDCRGDQT